MSGHITPKPAAQKVTFHVNVRAFQEYWNAGRTLIQLRPWHDDGKRPRDSNWTTREYDPKTVLAECTAGNLNAGVRLTPCDVVLDIDPRNGGDKSFRRFCADHGLDPSQWPRNATGGGGSHFYLKKPPGLRIVGALPGYPGLEFKTAGQQVVAAGSIHPDTKRYYRWDTNHPSLADAPEAPAALLDAIQRREPTGNVTEAGDYEPEQLADMLARLDPKDFRDQDKWCGLMMACHYATGGHGREEFIAWSTLDPLYADDEHLIGTRWDSLSLTRDGAVTFGTLRHYLIEAGASDAIPLDPDAAAADFAEPVEDEADDSWMDGSRGSEVMPIEERGIKVNNSSKAEDTFTNAFIAVRQSGLDPAFDVMSQTVALRSAPWDPSNGYTLNDHTMRIIRLVLSNMLQGNAYEPGEKHVFDALMTFAYRNKFNPVLDYLSGHVWDGVPRLDRLFVDYIPCGDDIYTRTVSAIFAIGAVRRMRQPGCKLDTMPVVKGPQGWGKSMGVQALCGRLWFSDADMGSLRDKDCAMKLRGVWIQEFAELDSLGRADVNTLKAFVTRAVDRQRDPYGRIVEDHPRRCVFIGTCNEGGYLKDSTGARRFLPLDLVDRVDVAAIERDRDQLWAEAAAREAAGEAHTLPAALWPVAAERQAAQTTDDPWVDTLRSFLEDRERAWEDRFVFEPGGDLDEIALPPDRVHTTELFAALAIPAERQTKGQGQRLRTVMESALGWKHTKNVSVGGRQGKGYTRTAKGSDG